MLIYAVYFSSRPDISLYNSNISNVDSLMHNNSDCKFLILGDYNFTNVNWVSLNNVATPNLSNVNNFYFNFLAGFSYLNLLQFNLVYNHSGSLLDLVFCNINYVNVFSVICPHVPLYRMYYPALLIKLSILFLKLLTIRNKFMTS